MDCDAFLHYRRRLHGLLEQKKGPPAEALPILSLVAIYDRDGLCDLYGHDLCDLCGPTTSRDRLRDDGDHVPSRSAIHGHPLEWKSLPIRPHTCQPRWLLPSLRLRT